MIQNDTALLQRVSVHPKRIFFCQLFVTVNRQNRRMPPLCARAAVSAQGNATYFSSGLAVALPGPRGKGPESGRNRRTVSCQATQPRARNASDN